MGRGVEVEVSGARGRPLTACCQREHVQKHYAAHSGLKKRAGAPSLCCGVTRTMTRFALSLIRLLIGQDCNAIMTTVATSNAERPQMIRYCLRSRAVGFAMA
jgi:hypothetical protein